MSKHCAETRNRTKEETSHLTPGSTRAGRGEQVPEGPALRVLAAVSDPGVGLDPAVHGASRRLRPRGTEHSKLDFWSFLCGHLFLRRIVEIDVLLQAQVHQHDPSTPNLSSCSTSSSTPVMKRTSPTSCSVGTARRVRRAKAATPTQPKRMPELLEFPERSPAPEPRAWRAGKYPPIHSLSAPEQRGPAWTPHPCSLGATLRRGCGRLPTASSYSSSDIVKCSAVAVSLVVVAVFCPRGCASTAAADCSCRHRCLRRHAAPST